MLAAATMVVAAGSGLAQTPGRGEQAEPNAQAPGPEDQAEPGDSDAQAPGRGGRAEPGATDRDSQGPGEQTPPAAPGGDAAPPSSAADAEKPYTVKCGPDPEEGGNVCLVDRATYVGWRTFHSVCHTCHAQDAVGSTFAPNLLERMKVIDKATFLMVLDQGFEGQVGVMPAWGNNPNVNKYYEELWSYLRARSDGALLPGRPKRLPESK